MRSLAAAILLGLLLSGCPSPVIDAYEAARADALAEPGPVPADWRPDALLTLSTDQVDVLVAEGLRRGGHLQEEIPISGPLGVKGNVKPDLEVDELSLGPSKGCKSCLGIDATISGDVAWTLGPAKGSFPLTATVALDTELSALETPSSWQVLARPHGVRKVEVEIGSTTRQVRGLAAGLLQGWIKEALEERDEPVLVTEIDRSELPVRALRVTPVSNSIRVEMLTNAGGDVAAKPMSTLPESGWRLEIARESLVAIVRRSSFEAGPVSHDVVIEPTSITLSSTRFELDLRLWRVKGRGWWRDYRAVGDVAVEGAKIALTPRDVEATGSSPGAVFADPLAAIVKGTILRAIEDSLATSVPGIHRQAAGDRTAVVRIADIDGTGAMVRILGGLDFQQPRTPKKKPQARPSQKK